MIVNRRSCGRIWRMWKQFSTLIGDAFDNMTLNMWTSIIVMEHDTVLFVRSFRHDYSVKVVEFSQIDIAADFALPLVVFLWNLPPLTLIIAVWPITNHRYKKISQWMFPLPSHKTHHIAFL